jgi:hypothetical protein
MLLLIMEACPPPILGLRVRRWLKSSIFSQSQPIPSRGWFLGPVYAPCHDSARGSS